MRLINADKLDKIIQTFQEELSSDNDKIWNKNKLAYKYLAYTRRELAEAETAERKEDGIWEPLNGMFTPGGDPAYICSICHNPDSEHINGIEYSKQWTFCPCCGAKLKY